MFQIYVDTNKGSKEYSAPVGVSETSSSSSDSSSSDRDTESGRENQAVKNGNYSFRLEELAYTRSGDKGNNCNIGE